jgi:hypothetical protein
MICSQPSPLPPVKYRPTFASGVTPTIAVDPEYARPVGLELKNSRFNLLLRDILNVSGGHREKALGAIMVSCNVGTTSITQWKSRSWEAFSREVPGGLGVVAFSGVLLSEKENVAYLFSGAQWGGLEGESDLWTLSHDREGHWRVVQMYPLSRS